MITQLTIINYALIDELTIDFSSGLSIITGETGAGKSILLGALGLVLGNRADTTSLKESSKKCIVEAKFSISSYGLKEFFIEADLDYEDVTIIRREILPSGKSRAFVNDTPVKLSRLNELKLYLIDIHSQHQTLQLSDLNFQFSVIDAIAKNKDNLIYYKNTLRELNFLNTELEELVSLQKEENKKYDYNLYLFNELEEANLDENEQLELEETLDKLNNIEDIKLNLSEALEISLHDEVGIKNLLNTIDNRLSKISDFTKEYKTLSERITSLKIEFDDIVNELEISNENIDFSPSELERTNDRLQLIYNLQKKHYVNTISELLSIKHELSLKIETVENSEEKIQDKKKQVEKVSKKLDGIAKNIFDRRVKIIPKLTSKLQKLLYDLGMPNAQFLIELNQVNQYFFNGKDKLKFHFSANKGSSFGELKKVASGGELSRIMLAVKQILSENKNLPTIIFDEIDTGVSGEISNKIASIMKAMSSNMQVITITHLPQIAAKGNTHYKVYKTENNNSTITNLKTLNSDERIVEIAEMLSGKSISESAIVHAKELLN